MPSRTRVGCDLQPIEDVTRAISDFGARYLDRIYTPAEQATYAAGGAASLAARFAAKEAVLKLLRHPDGVDPRSVEIRSSEGRPEVHLTGRAAELARDEGVDEIDISLSHTAGLALAVAVAATHSQPDPQLDTNIDPKE